MYLRQAKEIKDAPFDVWDFQRRCLDLPKPGNPIQIIELHSGLRLRRFIETNHEPPHQRQFSQFSTTEKGKQIYLQLIEPLDPGRESKAVQLH